MILNGHTIISISFEICLINVSRKTFDNVSSTSRNVI